MHRGDLFVIGVVGIDCFVHFFAWIAEIQLGKGQSRQGGAGPARVCQIDPDRTDVPQRTLIGTRLEVEPGAQKVGRDVVRDDPHGVVERRQRRIQRSPTERSIADGEALISIRFPHVLRMGRLECEVLAVRSDGLA